MRRIKMPITLQNSKEMHSVRFEETINVVIIFFIYT